jgi:D-aminopeptidase
MRDLVNEAGVTAWVLLLVLLAGGALCVVGLVLGLTKQPRASLTLAGAVAGFALAALILGYEGRQADLAGSYKAIAHASPADRGIILEGSRAEAQANTTLGFMVAVPLFVLSGVAGALARARGGKS